LISLAFSLPFLQTNWFSLIHLIFLETEDLSENTGKKGTSADAAAAGGFFHGWFGPLLATLFGHSSKEESAETGDY
jgi:hypothetical protein